MRLRSTTGRIILGHLSLKKKPLENVSAEGAYRKPFPQKKRKVRTYFEKKLQKKCRHRISVWLQKSNVDFLVQQNSFSQKKLQLNFFIDLRLLI